ncbi:hypothetical protein [Saccharopolyspora shandongensis]|uniref:hypothetical protein n=1 Tax=Saccharopolyspora shandongensis TaxID=418495 RepID=UPI003F4DCF9A
MHRFAPDVIVVAAGYDAGAYDPLGRQMLTSATFQEIARKPVSVLRSSPALAGRCHPPRRPTRGY